MPINFDSGIVQELVDRSSPEYLNSNIRISIPDEIRKSSPTRVGDYVSGRNAASHALQKLDAPIQVKRNPDGSPRWPQGITGSISHTRRFAWVAVARQPGIASIGIDCEKIIDQKIAEEIKDLVGNELEYKTLASQFDFCSAASMLFCGKESVYKCLNPLTNWPLDFHDVEFRSIDNNSITAFVDASRFSGPNRIEVEIKFGRHELHLFSSCVLNQLAFRKDFRAYSDISHFELLAQ